jgi:hypothetical protein
MAEETKVKKTRVKKAAEKPLIESEGQQPPPPPKTQQESLYDQLNDPNTAAGLVRSAENLRDRFRGNWFSLLQIIKKTNIKSGLDARQLMNMLELKGLCVKEVHHREEVYKITISKQIQISNLEKQLAQLDEQKALIQNAIDQLRVVEDKEA